MFFLQGCVFPTIAVTAKLLGPELTEMSRTLRVTGSILTLICVTATLTITVTVDSYQALEFPFAAAAVLYMLYCAVLFSRQTMLPVYGHLFFWVWITGVLFRELSYWIIGPLYATSAGARGICVVSREVSARVWEAHVKCVSCPHCEHVR